MILYTKKKGLLTIFGILFGLGTFTIFGLTMSVGLIVHHKINAQNSVDIGAIYAAQKQAETLSVLSHFNYQLWQNYKLLSYRYNFLGNIGAYRKQRGSTVSDQIDILNSQPLDNMFCPNTSQDCINNFAADYCDKNDVLGPNSCSFAFCLWHPFFHIPGKNQDSTNVCQNVDKELELAQENSGGIGIGYRLAQRTVGQLNNQIRNSCNSVGYVNWLVASASYLSFYYEQQKRKEFIEKYFKEIIKAGLDLDGKSIEESVKKTIVKNLTLPIHQSEKFIYAKGSPNSENKDFDKYFDWVYVDPVELNLNYVQNKKDLNDTSTCRREIIDIFKACESKPKCLALDIPNNTCNAIHNHPSSYDPIPRDATKRCQELNYIEGENPVIGFKLKGDLLNKTNFYSQVFMYVNFHGGIFFPFRNPIPMVAQAFSKPFGASFGNPTDLGFLSVYPLGADPSKPQYGLLAAKRQVKLHDLMDRFTGSLSLEQTGFNLLSYMDLKVEGSAGMVLPLKPTSTPNSYGIDSDNILAFSARIMEEIAIAPDEYDETNFSILTNYMLSAYIRLKESGVKFITNTNRIGDYIPPDIGHYDGEEFLEKIPNKEINQSDILNPNNSSLEVGSVKPSFFLNYIQRQIDLVKSYWQLSDDSKKLTDIDYTLTSWVPHMKGELFTGKAEFRDISQPQRGSLQRVCNTDPPVQCCFLRITDLKMAQLKVIPKRNSTGYLSWDKSNKRKHIPHLTHCVAGGRSGFSVKIIHPSTVSKDLLSSEKGRHRF